MNNYRAEQSSELTNKSTAAGGTSGFSPKISPNSRLPTTEEDVEYPLTAGKALKLYMDKITDYEKGEVLDY
jgi:hypothetical protein